MGGWEFPVRDTAKWDGIIWAKGIRGDELTWGNGTTGSVLFIGSNGEISQDNSKLFWDDTTNRLGIGTSSPTSPLTIVGSIEGTSGERIDFGNESPSQLQFYADMYFTFNRGAAERWIMGEDTDIGVGIFSFYTNTSTDIHSKRNLYAKGKVGIATTSPNTTLHVSGAISLGVQSKTASYAITTSDYLVLFDATTAALTATLPAATNKGMIVEIIKTDNSINAVTVSRAGSDTIEGATSKSLASQYDKTRLIADGTSTWYDEDTGLI